MNKYTNRILITLCEKLQLSDSLYELAEQRYHTIADIIENAPVMKGVSLNMYAHGSFRLKTTVKPLKGEEYDLDFVVEIAIDNEDDMTPTELYNHIYDILSNDGIHNTMVEKKNRCIRVNYANDFHMDIMPGKQINAGTKEIIVPDKELKYWYHHSNPIRYAEWFEEQAKTQIITEINQMRKVLCSTEPIEEHEIVARLEPLRRAVQLIKRYRDIYCDKHNTASVRSIIICTLMGHITSSYSDELQIIMDFCSYVSVLAAESGGEPFEVRNPVVNEMLSEKWIEDTQNYKDFISMTEALKKDIHRLSALNINSDINTLLKEMFGETVTNDAIKEYAKSIGVQRDKGNLSVDSAGRLNTSNEGNKIRKNTFYGEAQF